jgi:predicted secreted protein
MTGWVSGVFIYVLIWFVVLFTVLPWGVKIPDNPEPGHAPSAPIDPRIGAKLVATSLVSAVVWAIVWYVMQSGWISFRPT